MTNFSHYDAIIERHATVFIVICAVLLIASCIGIVLMILWAKDSETRDDKITNRIILTLSIVCAVMSLVFIISTSYAANYDIKNQAYVVYEGEFEVVNKKSGANVFIKTNKKIMLDMAETSYIEDGVYQGKILYSQKTKLLFEVELYQDDNLFLIKTSFFSNPIDKYFILCYTVRMIEVRFEKSNCHEKALDRALWQGKVLVPKNSFDSSRFWQTGEYPSCCRSNAESYPTSDFQIDGCVVT